MWSFIWRTQTLLMKAMNLQFRMTYWQVQTDRNWKSLQKMTAALNQLQSRLFHQSLSKTQMLVYLLVCLYIHAFMYTLLSSSTHRSRLSLVLECHPGTGSDMRLRVWFDSTPIHISTLPSMIQFVFQSIHLPYVRFPFHFIVTLLLSKWIECNGMKRKCMHFGHLLYSFTHPSSHAYMPVLFMHCWVLLCAEFRVHAVQLVRAFESCFDCWVSLLSLFRVLNKYSICPSIRCCVSLSCLTPVVEIR